MKCLLVAINAKYIHSNPGVYSLKRYAQSLCPNSSVEIQIGEYTINNQMELILEDIYKRKPDVVGISCYIWNITHVLHLVNDIHKVLPKTDIWLGGPEVSYDGVNLLQREPQILGVMKGEGEETFARLMACYGKLGSSVGGSKDERRLEVYWEDLEALSGITFTRADGVLADRDVHPVMDMSCIPFLYENMEGFDHRIVYYESSRGCPFSCSYCLSSIDKSVRFRDVELVKKELDFFLEHQVPQVKFVDRTFNCKKSHAIAIWSHILEHDNGVTNFHFEIAADLLDEDALTLISKMRPGLIQLEIGVQSTNEATIQEIRRIMDVDALGQIVRRVNEGHNVHQHLDLIAGLPYEDYESFRHSFNTVYAMRPDQLQLGFLKVLKGSYMYEKAEEYGLVYRSLPPYEVLSTKWLSYGQVLKLKGVEEMVEVYYNSGQFTKTLSLSEPVFSDAFTMFESMAAYYNTYEEKGHSHSRISRYERLYQWICDTLPQIAPKDAADALIYDLYLRENSKSRPSFAPDQRVHKERIRKAFPELHTLGTQAHGEVLHSGEILMFDYRIRDPLTNNGVVRREASDGKA